MNIKPVDANFFRFTSKYGNRKIVLEMDGDSTKDELCDAFASFLNACGYHYTDHIKCLSNPDESVPPIPMEEDLEYGEDLPF